MSGRQRAIAVAILVAALALRLAYVIFVVGDDGASGDQIYYSAQAEVITRGQFFDHPFTGEPAADHPPVNSMLLAIPSIGGGDPLYEQRIFMAFLGTAAVGAIMALGFTLTPGSRRVGLIAGTIAAFYPGLWINDGLVMAETPTTLITALLLLVAVRYQRGQSGPLLLGIVGGIAILTRAELGLLLVIIALPFGIGLRGPLLPRMGRYVAVGLAAAAVMAPWTLFNLTRFEEPVLVSTNDGLTIIGSNCDPSYNEGIGFWHLQCATEVEGDQSQVSSQYRDIGLEYVADHADELPKVVAARIGRAWGFYRPMDNVFLNRGEGRPKLASEMAMYAWWLLLPMAVAGVFVARRRRLPWPLLAAPVIAVTVVVIATYGIPRFRLPAEVGAVLLAAIALAALLDRIRPPESN